MKLVWPAREHLPSYAAALERGWSPDNIRGAEATREQLQEITADPDGFLARLVVRAPNGELLNLPDGSQVPRLPGYRRWLWDGELCGTIGFRWQPGTSELPAHVLGHVGYAVVPWKRRLGLATEALRQLLPEARAEGLDPIDITMDTDNQGSRRVAELNGAHLVEQFFRPAEYGGAPALRFRIELR